MIGEHDMCSNVLTGDDMAEKRPTRFNVVLDEEHAARLYALAERSYLQPGALARSLLSGAIDEMEPDARTVTAILDAIPGAWDSVQRGEADYAAGRLIALEEFVSKDLT
jgi:predicted transcriptional regulator